jgi:hypothetical protein
VVARNLAINREHDGPVVITEPYFMNEPVRHKDCWPEITQELGSWPVASVEAFSGSMRTALRQELWTRMRGRVGNFSNIQHEAAIG